MEDAGGLEKALVAEMSRCFGLEDIGALRRRSASGKQANSGGKVQFEPSDLLFVGEDGKDAWVAPIELKSGRFHADEVKDQLQKGADLADKWLPTNAAFRFVPVVAHGKGIPKHKIGALRQAAVTLRGQKRRPVLIRCHSPLREALDVSPSGAAKVQRP